MYTDIIPSAKAIDRFCDIANNGIECFDAIDYLFRYTYTVKKCHKTE